MKRIWGYHLTRGYGKLSEKVRVVDAPFLVFRPLSHHLEKYLHVLWLWSWNLQNIFELSFSFCIRAASSSSQCSPQPSLSSARRVRVRVLSAANLHNFMWSKVTNKAQRSVRSTCRITCKCNCDFILEDHLEPCDPTGLESTSFPTQRFCNIVWWWLMCMSHHQTILQNLTVRATVSCTGFPTSNTTIWFKKLTNNHF